MALRTGDLVISLYKRSDSWKDLQDNDLDRLKKEMLEITDDIVTVCEKHNIKYILSYGSALGAIRHKGYIPWDDDIDISMPREDYNKFIEVAEKEIGDRYFIRCVTKGDSISVPTCHVKKKHTRYVNFSDLISLADEPEETKCIYVDIFPLENSSDIKWIRTLDAVISLSFQFIWACIRTNMSLKQMKAKGIILTSEERSALRLKAFLGKFFSFIPLYKWLQFYDKFAQKNKNNNSKYVTSYTGYKSISKSTYLRDKVCETVDAEFEGRMWRVPKDYDYYLTKIYKDYMVVPKSNNRKVHPIFELDFEKNTYDK